MASMLVALYLQQVLLPIVTMTTYSDNPCRPMPLIFNIFGLNGIPSCLKRCHVLLDCGSLGRANILDVLYTLCMVWFE